MATWWVNQGRTYEVEIARGYLFAPLRNKAGRPLDHWESMTQLRLGDSVIHYAKGAVRAVSNVSTVASRDRRPVPLPEPWFNDGWIAQVAISNATLPVLLESIPEALRLGEVKGPFDVSGKVRQIYLLPVSDEFASTFFAMFGTRFGETFALADANRRPPATPTKAAGCSRSHASYPKR